MANDIKNDSKDRKLAQWKAVAIASITIAAIALLLFLFERSK